MVNLRWNVYNMVTIWLMVGLLYVGMGFARSLYSNMSGAQS